MADTKEPSDSLGNSLQPMPALETAFPREAAPADTADTTYKPLSIWSMLGFGLALIYTVYVLVMAVSALFLGKPALIPLLSLGVPLTAIVVCVLARIQIALSENTLAGRSLTSWGIILSVVVGLTYCAYNLAVYLALRNQAEVFAKEWLTQLSQNETSKAALQVLPPGQRVGLEDIEQADELNKEIELRVRASEKDAPKQYMRHFRQHELVRSLGEAGPDAKIEFKGIRSWEYVRNAYEVLLTFRVTTPDSSYDTLVMVRGLEAENEEFRGRQWHVDLKRTGLPREAETLPTYSAEGQKNTLLSQSASIFAGNWSRKISEGRTEEGVLDLVPPAARESASAATVDETQLGAAAGAAPVTLRPTPAGPLKSAQELLAGPFLALTGRMYRPGDRRMKAADKVRARLTQTGRDDSMRFDLEPVIPRRIEKGDRIQFVFDIKIQVMPKDVLTGILVVECDKAERTKSNAKQIDWQIVRLELQGAEDAADGGTMPPPPR